MVTYVFYYCKFFATFAIPIRVISEGKTLEGLGITMRKIHYLIPVFLILLFVMFILPFYSTEGYLLFKNTTSQLGAQSTPNAWIMNLTFFLLGIASIIEGGMYLKNYCFQKILITIFGLGLMFTAYFHHAPIIEDIPYSIFEDKMHSIFASVVGFSFTIFSISVAFIEKEIKKKRMLSFFIGIIATGLSLLMFNVPDYAGLWQRLIFILSFAWLIYFFEGRRHKYY